LARVVSSRNTSRFRCRNAVSVHRDDIASISAGFEAVQQLDVVIANLRNDAGTVAMWQRRHVPYSNTAATPSPSEQHSL
jgi:hypothetical protein